jgi:hypothetical protein
MVSRIDLCVPPLSVPDSILEMLGLDTAKGDAMSGVVGLSLASREGKVNLAGDPSSGPVAAGGVGGSPAAEMSALASKRSRASVVESAWNGR